MKKVLIAADETRGAEAAVQTFIDLFSANQPETVVLLYVQKIEGRSLMDDLLGDAELSTLKEALTGTEYQEHLDRKARKITAHYAKLLGEKGFTGIKEEVREGHPADEILSAADAESAGLIIIGTRGRRMHNFFMGSVSREVANRAEIPVLLAK